MERFGKDGRLIIPLGQRKSGTEKPEEEKVRYVVTEAYCPNGCSLIDKEHEINGAPGLRMKFSRQGVEGELVLSAIEGDFTKIVISGELEEELDGWEVRVGPREAVDLPSFMKQAL